MCGARGAGAGGGRGGTAGIATSRVMGLAVRLGIHRPAQPVTSLRASQVDAAVVEVGLGGTRDATNVLPAAGLAAAVITAVGRDHAAALGGTIEAIAAAKAGIMQPGRPVVLGRQP